MTPLPDREPRQINHDLNVGHISQPYHFYLDSHFRQAYIAAMSDKTLSTELKKFRMERELTLQRLAALTGVSVMTLSRIENQRVKPSDLTIAKITKAIPQLAEVA